MRDLRLVVALTVLCVADWAAGLWTQAVGFVSLLLWPGEWEETGEDG